MGERTEQVVWAFIALGAFVALNFVIFGASTVLFGDDPLEDTYDVPTPLERLLDDEWAGLTLDQRRSICESWNVNPLGPLRSERSELIESLSARYPRQVAVDHLDGECK